MKVIIKCVNIKLWDILSCFHYILNAPRTHSVFFINMISIFLNVNRNFMWIFKFKKPNKSNDLVKNVMNQDTPSKSRRMSPPLNVCLLNYKISRNMSCISSNRDQNTKKIKSVEEGGHGSQRNDRIKLTDYDETKKKAHDSQIV